MKLLVDEDTKANILLARLRQAGHDVVTTQDLGKDSAADPEIFELARSLDRVMLTKNVEDYFELHAQFKESGHPGVLAIYESSDPSKDMSYKAILQSIDNILASGISLANNFLSLNEWNWKPDLSPGRKFP